MDPFGRPITRTAGDAALDADVAQAALAARNGGFSPSYGGRRFVGDVRRGGLLGSPWTVYGLPVRAARRANSSARPRSASPATAARRAASRRARRPMRRGDAAHEARGAAAAAAPRAALRRAAR
jgi:hypothetical protein